MAHHRLMAKRMKKFSTRLGNKSLISLVITINSLITNVFNFLKYGNIESEWKSVSKSAKDLINKMLCPAAVRLSAVEVLEHPWLKEEQVSNEEPLALDFKSLKNFQNAERLKKAALTYIAAQCNYDEIEEMTKAFQELDKTGKGSLTLKELKAGII